MKRSTFLLITSLASFGFGAMMLAYPVFAGDLLGIAAKAETLSVLRGMGGLIIGSGAINFFLRKSGDPGTLRGLLLTNILTHALGLFADAWGIADGVLSIGKMAPVELTHLFVGIGSAIFLLSVLQHKRKPQTVRSH
jgi:hypothetical protein